MSSAASDRHVVDNVSDPVSAEACEGGEWGGGGGGGGDRSLQTETS